MKHPMLRFGIIVMTVLLLPPPAFAGRGKKDRKGPKYAADKSWRAPLPMHTLSIRVIGGKLVGSISDSIEQYNDEVKQQLHNGCGIGFESSFKNR